MIINVVDASNLERNFYLTTQLIDMNVRMVIALNMYDELEASGNKLDYLKLSQLFGVPMVPTVCRKGEGVDKLFHVIIGIYEGSDFLTQKKAEIRTEVLEDLRDWHETYVPDHKFGSHSEEVKADVSGIGAATFTGTAQMASFHKGGIGELNTQGMEVSK